MHCTGKQDTIYIYNTSDRSKQKLLVDVLIYFSFWHPKWLPTFLGYLMLIKIKYGRYNNRLVRTHESDSEVTIRWLGKIIQRIFFCSIRSQHSQSRLEMVCRDSFPRGSYTFIENFCRYDFCPALLRFAPTNCPWVSEDGLEEAACPTFCLILNSHYDTWTWYT